MVPNNVNRVLFVCLFERDFEWEWLKDIHQICFFPPSWESDQVKETFSFAPFPTQVHQPYLGMQGRCRAPPGWSLLGRMCPWSWGTAENAAANQGHSQGQGSFGSRRTRTSRVSNLVSLEGKMVQAYCIEAPARLAKVAGRGTGQVWKTKRPSRARVAPVTPSVLRTLFYSSMPHPYLRQSLPWDLAKLMPTLSHGPASSPQYIPYPHSPSV